jgi:hypothetical protein
MAPMPDWKMLAAARDLKLTDDEVARISGPLDGLEASWRPLLKRIPFEKEPAVIMQCIREIQSEEGK